MLYSQIKEEIKIAMKNKDSTCKDVLKMVVDKAKAIVKEKNPAGTEEDIADDIVLQAIRKEVKQLNQTKESLHGKEDTELYISTTRKIDILSQYLPVQMTEEELKEFIERELIELINVNVEISPKIKGMVMKNIMPELKGKADNKMIAQILDKLLNQ